MFFLRLSFILYSVAYLNYVYLINTYVNIEKNLHRRLGRDNAALCSTVLCSIRLLLLLLTMFMLMAGSMMTSYEVAAPASCDDDDDGDDY